MKYPERIALTIAVLCIVALAWMAWSARSARAETCHTLASFKTEVLDHIPGAVMTPIDQAQLPGFLRMFNSFPPVSHYDADEIEIVTIPNDPNKVAVLFNHGCGLVFQRIAPPIFEALMGSDT